MTAPRERESPRASAILDVITASEIKSPAFVYSTELLKRSLQRHRCIADEAGCELLYAAKACSIPFVLDAICEYVDGLSASSPFEARLLRDRLGTRGSIHAFQVALKPEDVEQLGSTVDYISFNSVNQFEQFGPQLSTIHQGIRLNPGLAFVRDQRYNPCRPFSRLGVQLTDFDDLVRARPKSLTQLKGIHFHTNCDSPDLGQLLQTVQKVHMHLSSLADQIEWVNVGGGYLFEESASLDQLFAAAELLQRSLGVKVFLEPGASIVRRAGFLVASVVDMVSSDRRDIAILDTSVNHLPEVFEYQYEPDVIGCLDSGRFSYVLGGSTCLAGDVFGEYFFDEPLEVGKRVVFENVGAYTTVKWHRFNGVNLPNVYELSDSEVPQPLLRKHFTFGDFLSSCGGERSGC